VFLIDLFASRDWLRAYLFLAVLCSTLVYLFLFHVRAQQEARGSSMPSNRGGVTSALGMYSWSFLLSWTLFDM